MMASDGFGMDSDVGFVSSSTSAGNGAAPSAMDSVLWALDVIVGSEKECLMGSSSSSRSIGSELYSRVGSAGDDSGTFEGDREAICAISAGSTLISLTAIVGGSADDFAGVGEGESSPSSLSPSSPSSPSLPSSLPSSPS